MSLLYIIVVLVVGWLVLSLAVAMNRGRHIRPALDVLTVAQPAGAIFGDLGRHLLDDVVLSTAPEPTTWAMMILGLGGAGAMLRRRRSQLA